MAITIKNLIEIRNGPGGGYIQIPGCEPTSIHTSEALARNMRDICTSSLISVTQALAAVPGSKVIVWQNSGGGLGQRIKFFQLPDGPPQVGCDSQGRAIASGGTPCVTDYYALLRQYADGGNLGEAQASEDQGPGCSVFSFSKYNAETF